MNITYYAVIPESVGVSVLTGGGLLEDFTGVFNRLIFLIFLVVIASLIVIIHCS